MTSSVTNTVKTFALIVLGLAIARSRHFSPMRPRGRASLRATVRRAVGQRAGALATMGGAVDRARSMVRAAIVEQNLPGVSIAVGRAGASSGPKGSDGGTSSRRRPSHRRPDSTSAPRHLWSTPRDASLGMTNTGTDSAAEWSPVISGSRKRTSRPSRSSTTSSSGRLVSPTPRSHCRAIARRSTSRRHDGGTTQQIPARDDD